MDYLEVFKKMAIDSEEMQAIYPRNDIGVARLFHHLHADILKYVPELKCYYLFNGKRWGLDDAGVSTLCTNFTRVYAKHAKKVQGTTLVPKTDGYKDFETYAAEFHKLSRRKAILEDARAIDPKSIAEFDDKPFLLNLNNGTYDLEKMEFREHRSSDFLTKIVKVDFVKDAVCERWIKFIPEVMDGNNDMAQYLQKALGYALSGDTSQDCFFINYGPKTRNGKSTLTGAVEHLLGDYAMSAQPQTLARRYASGAAPSPDIARLKGARFVNMQEPAKGLELDAALVKQLTGGDAIVARFLGKNPIQYKPEFTIFVSANHMPKITDRTVLTSGRLKVILFNRHFKPGEQDENLLQMFKEPDAMSGILNWLIEGYAMYRQDGKLIDPQEVQAEIENFRRDSTGQLDDFLKANLKEAKGKRVKTHDIHKLHCEWAREHGFLTLSQQAFVGELRTKYDVQRFTNDGNAVVGYILNKAINVS